MGRKEHSGAYEGVIVYRVKEVEIKNSAVITRMSDLFQSPISHLEHGRGQKKGNLDEGFKVTYISCEN